MKKTNYSRLCSGLFFGLMLSLLIANPGAALAAKPLEKD